MLSAIQNRLRSLFRKKKTFVEKDTLYYEFSEALQSGECPVCHLLDRYEHRFIQSIFYESVNDGAVRRKIKQSHGFCAQHTRQFLQTGDILGLSIIGADLLESWVMNPDSEYDDSCLLCQLRHENEVRLTQAFIRYYCIDTFKDAFKSGAGLCLKHFHIIFKGLKEPAFAVELKQTEEMKIKRLIADLNEVIRKHDYRFKEEAISKKEIRAVRQVWNFLRR